MDTMDQRKVLSKYGTEWHVPGTMVFNRIVCNMLKYSTEWHVPGTIVLTSAKIC